MTMPDACTGEPVQPPACTSDHCITCSDEAVQASVVELLEDGFALVRVGAGTEEQLEEVSVALVSAAVGDTVVVHAREAIGKLEGGP